MTEINTYIRFAGNHSKRRMLKMTLPRDGKIPTTQFIKIHQWPNIKSMRIKWVGNVKEHAKKINRKEFIVSNAYFVCNFTFCAKLVHQKIYIMLRYC